MENLKKLFEKYFLFSIVVTNYLNNHLSWMKNPLKNQFILSAKIDYSINRLSALLDTRNNDANRFMIHLSIKVLKNDDA